MLKALDTVDAATKIAFYCYIVVLVGIGMWLVCLSGWQSVKANLIPSAINLYGWILERYQQMMKRIRTMFAQSKGREEVRRRRERRHDAAFRSRRVLQQYRHSLRSKSPRIPGTVIDRVPDED